MPRHNTTTVVVQDVQNGSLYKEEEAAEKDD